MLLAEHHKTKSAPAAKDSALSGSIRLEPLDRSRYPKVINWTKSSWLLNSKDGKGQTITRTTIEVDDNMIKARWHFIQNEDGELIDKAMLGRITTAARGKFNEMATKGVLPPRWDKIQWAIRKDFEHDMEHEFFVLRLCENNWKANEVATLLFPGFKQNNKSLFAEVKTEPSATTATGDAFTTSKRKFSETIEAETLNAAATQTLPAAKKGKERAVDAPRIQFPNPL